MYKHHQEAIDAITSKLAAREDVLGVIIGGSVAHGFAAESSDIDIMIVLSEEDYQKTLKHSDVVYFETESCSYKDGYVDGKYISVDFIEKVAAFGSEPAKFAFQGAFVTYSRFPELERLVRDASVYPVDMKAERYNAFYAQFETWRWYYYEALKRNNKLLIDYSLSQYVMFAGRLILAYNETVFPSYKWFLKVLEQTEHKPEDFMQLLNSVIEEKTEAAVEALFCSTAGFHNWYTSDKHWTSRFMIDSQINWLEGAVPVMDL
ncbi:nucleotidyltransferase domain-containing protein [Gorillibacterium massiliense]|uniref:nucleotidyltransferase domain-containing protein n=1 Tax=Gorillibacterium massiliense TaxID=1280390 RepID=UPI0004AE8EB1|nr:nucleotidyltransferase domain-containing protein [Gorillibacterium massiliense]